MPKNVNWVNVAETPGAPCRVENTTWSALDIGDEFYHGSQVMKVAARTKAIHFEGLAIQASRLGRNLGWRVVNPNGQVNRIV